MTPAGRRSAVEAWPVIAGSPMRWNVSVDHLCHVVTRVGSSHGIALRCTCGPRGRGRCVHIRAVLAELAPV